MTKVKAPDYILLQWIKDKWIVSTWGGVEACMSKQKDLLTKGQGSLLVQVTPLVSVRDSDGNEHCI